MANKQYLDHILYLFFGLFPPLYHTAAHKSITIFAYRASVFNELYQQMNGMPLQELDKIIYPICKLCRDHERAGFIEGIKTGIMLVHELTER